MPLTGRVTEVVTEATKTGVVVDAAAGASVLFVDSVAAFPDDGGTLRLTMLDASDDIVTEDIDYTTVDQEAQSFDLDGVTVNAYPAEALVELIDPIQPSTTVFVATNDNQEDMAAFCPQELKAVYAVALEDGIRDPGTGVGVVVAERYGRWTIVEVQAPPTIASATLTGMVPEDLLPEIPTASDGDVPTVAPTVTARSVPGFVELRWPEPANPDVLLGYRVYVGTSSGMSSNAGTQHSVVGGTLALIRTLPDGTAMVPGTTYWFTVAAEDFDGVGPASTAVAASVGFQSTPDIETGSVTASMLQSILVLASQFVGKQPPLVVTNKALASNTATLTTEIPHDLEVGARVNVTGVDGTFNGSHVITSVPSTTTFTYAKTASDVSSTAVVGGLADPSQRWEADSDGIRFYNQAGIPVIDLPTNSSPANPASFYGSMVAVGLQVLDNLSITGDNNELSAGATFTLKSGVTKPSLSPTVSFGYREGPTFDLTGIDTSDMAWDFDGGSWWLLYYDHAADEMRLAEFDTDGGQPVSDIELPDDFGEYPEQLVKIGDHVYARVDDNGGRILYWNLASLTLPVQKEDDTKRIGHDYADQQLIVTTSSAGTLSITVRNAASYASVSTHSFSHSYHPRVDASAGDFGGKRFFAVSIFTGILEVGVLSTASTPVYSATESFPAISGGDGVLYDGTRFVERDPPVSFGQTTARRREYSNIKTADGGSTKWWVGATWRDSDATSPDFANVETDLGPKQFATFKRRAFLNASMSALPAAPVDALTFYVGRGTTEPANTAMWRQPPPAAGVASVQHDTIVLTGTSPTDNPPAANTFPGGSPSKIAAHAGGFEVDAESGGQWHKKAVTPRFVGETAAATTSQGTGGTPAVIAFTENATHSSGGDYWNFASNQLTVLEAGWWDIHATQRWAANATGGRQIYIYVNGAAVYESTKPGSSAGTQSTDITATLKLNANDVVEIRGRHTAGANLDYLGGSASNNPTRFQAVYAGPAE